MPPRAVCQNFRDSLLRGSLSRLRRGRSWILPCYEVTCGRLTNVVWRLLCGVRLTPSMRRPVRVKTVFVFTSVDSLPSSRAALSPSFHPQSVLSDSRSLQGGRSQFSRCCYLIIDLGSCLLDGSWGQEFGAVTGSRRLSSAVPIRLFFSFFLPFPVFHREISSQDRLGTTIANSVDP
jgi:hypothetical protein